MSNTRGRSRSGVRTRQNLQDDDTHSVVSNADSERSETPRDDAHLGALTPRGSSTAIEQLLANTSRQTDAFLETLRMLVARPQAADQSQAMADLIQAQSEASIRAARITAEIKADARAKENAERQAQRLEKEEARRAHAEKLAAEVEERRARAAGMAEARRQAAELAAAVANKPTVETAVAISTKSTNEIRRSLRDAQKCNNLKDWCSHIYQYNEFCKRHNLTDHMTYLHVEDTLLGDALLTWRGFLLQWSTTELAAWTAHTTFIEAANTSMMPDDWIPPTRPPLFDWRLEFEKQVFFFSQFDASVARWRGHKQGTTEPPKVTLQDLWLSHERAFQSWGRFRERITEMDRVSQLLLCLSPRNRQYLLIPGAPNTDDPACTHAEVFRWVLKCANFGPSQDEYQEMQTSALGSLPVNSDGVYVPKSTPRRGRPKLPPRPQQSASASRTSRSPSRRRDADSSICLRCHDMGHWASACEAALSPAQVRENVTKVAEARHKGECFLCHSTEHWADSCTAGPALPVEILAIWGDVVQNANNESDDEDAWPGDEDSVPAYGNLPATMVTTCVTIAPAQPPPLDEPAVIVPTGPPTTRGRRHIRHTVHTQCRRRDRQLQRRCPVHNATIAVPARH